MPFDIAHSGPTTVLPPLNEDVLHIIWRRRRSIWAMILLCLAAATLYLLSTKAVYAVTTQLYVERKSTAGLPDRSQEFLHTQVALLQSTSVLRLALDRPDVKPLRELAGLTQPIRQVRDRLTSDVGSKDGIITLSLKCADPEQGAHLLNSIVDAYIGQQSKNGPLPAANVVVLENADANATPKWPRKPQVLAVATALGLLLGSGWALLRGRTDQRLYTATEVARAGHVPVAAVVPHNPSPINGDSSRHAAETYRMLSTAIQYNPTPQQPRTILVTSPAPADGKTTVAVGLAKALAAAGERTILLDLNSHNPAVALIFGSKPGAGLSQVLAGTLNLNQAVHPTTFPGLDILPFGSDAGLPPQTMAGEAFRNLLAKLSKDYARVVLDAPAVLSFADARIAAAICNATLLVLRLGKSTSSDYAEAYAALTTVNGRVLGVVVNDAIQGPAGNRHQIT
ncbi:MAG: polysaccharide biosynthesis tyrosine autokinase [Planctomycetota bacterium]|nr:polysaccharide biosynthesis tyrosine autokinase [Planctomycetota bacterium]